MTGSEDNTARLVSGVSGKVLGTLAAHAETLECVGLSGDFPFAASGAIDAKLVVWDLNTLQPRNTLTHDKAVSALRWIPGTACLYRCVRHDRNAKRRRLVVSLVPRTRLRGFSFRDSRFAIRNERASLGYSCRCGGGQQFARLDLSRRTLLRCTATLRSRVNNLHPPTRFVSETVSETPAPEPEQTRGTFFPSRHRLASFRTRTRLRDRVRAD